MWFCAGGNPRTQLTDWMNFIPNEELAFDHEPGTYICNCFTLHPTIFEEDLQMETKVVEIPIDETDYTWNPHSRFHLYSSLLSNIDFQNHFSFPVPIYAYPLPTRASAHAMTTDELLDQPMLLATPELSDGELLETQIFDLNIAKLPATVATSSLTGPPATVDHMVSATLINNFLKLMLDDISSLAPVLLETSTLTHQTEMDTKAEATATSDKTLTDITQESMVNNETAMDVVQPPTAVDPLIYLATQGVLPSPLMIPTVAAAKYIPTVRFLHEYVSDTQWAALAAILKAYNFPPPLSGMLFPEHHWPDYLLHLCNQIIEILIPAKTAPPARPQQMPLAPTALIVAQLAAQLIAAQLRPMVPMDTQQPQQPSTSTANLDKNGQLFHKPAHYEHSIKRKTQQQEEVKSHKAHKSPKTDELHHQCTPPPSMPHTEHSKTPSQRTTKGHEQEVKQKERQTAGQASATTGATVQLKVTPTKHSCTQTKTVQSLVQPQKTPLA
uniref:Uncharacterized protein n=1 Tax=Romanomermis culicivorax TaxID=13658 RepID=A0A915JY51_ROMCU